MVEKDYQVVILVGGLGQRFYPVTETIPKPMVEINGRPFLEIKLESIKRYGLKNIVLCVGHLGHMIEEYFGTGEKFGLNIKYAYEKELLGTAGAIKNAEEFIEDDFIAMNGDTYIPVDFDELIKFHESHSHPMTMVVANATNPKEQELVEIDEGIIRKIYKRNTIEHDNHIENNLKPLINGGVYIIRKNLLNEIPKGKKVSIEHEIFPKLEGKMGGFTHTGYIKDLTNQNFWDEIKDDFNKGITR
ncbi:MAG: sugar phosphate nucleotidyltransferase [Candidatus Pacearchaeota archaeon]|jgi:NDP-sugar pyrophosphorylase family protein